MEASNEIIWLVAGLVLITLEFTILPGVCMLFAGVAALIVGALTETVGLTFTQQCIIFLVTTIALSLLFYKKLRNYQANKDVKYSDMVGQSATVIGTLAPGTLGQVKWSGTNMKARLQGGSTLSEGAHVKITAVDGNVVIVSEE